MRETFANQLAELEERMGSDLGRAVRTLADIADAVRDPTDPNSEAIAQAALRLRNASRNIDTDLVTITARQAPVASDLRLVLALVQLAHHESLIANQFEMISQQLTDIDPGVRDRNGTAENISSMAALASLQLQHASTAFRSRDLVLARGLEREDDAIDKLNRDVFKTTVRDLVGARAARDSPLGAMPARADGTRSWISWLLPTRSK